MTRLSRTGTIAVQNCARDAQILELKAAGWSLEQIGAEFGLNASTIHRIIDARLKAAKPEQTELYRQSIWLRLQNMEAKTLDQAYGEHYKRDDKGREIFVPATDEDGEALLDAGGNPIMTRIRDFTDNNTGKAIILKIWSDGAKLLGLPAPVKTSTTFEQSPAEPLTFTVRDGGPRHPTLARLSQAELDDVLRYIDEKGFARGPEKPTKPLAQLMHTFLGGAQPSGTTYEG